MSNLTIFKFENTPVQTIVENNEIFFRAAQLAELLQYKNPHKAIKDHVDPDDLTKREIVNTINKRAQVIFVNESGMYSLVLSSKLEQAKKVKRWVTSEVLPAIRKTGKYLLQPKQPALPVVTDDFKQAMIKILNYASQYEVFQRAICTKRGEAQQRQMEFFFSEISDKESYLFVFKPNIAQDIQQASDLLHKLITQ